MTQALPSQWTMHTLDSLLVSKRDLTYGIVQPGPHTPGGVPIVRVKDLRDGRVDTKDPLLVGSEIEAGYARSRLTGGELLVSLVGTVGQTAVAGEDLVGWNVARAIAVVRLKPEVGARWVSWVMQMTASTQLIAERVNTTVQTTLNLADLRDLEVPVPPDDERLRISGLLGALDDKIESNERAQVLGELLVRSYIAETLEEASGEKMGALGDLFELVKDQAPAYELSNLDTYIGFEHMPRGSIFLDKWGTAESVGSHKSRFAAGDVLFGKLRPYFRKVGIAPVSGVCSTDILVLRPKEPRDTALVVIVASSDPLIESLSASATGTRMPRASAADLAAWPVPLLSETTRYALGNKTVPLLERLTALTHESIRLAELRDTLLPELLSGRIRAREAIEVLGEAVV